MGQYIQAGICTSLTLRHEEGEISPADIEGLTREVSAQVPDFSLFRREGADLRWTLRRELLEQGLVPFLRSQYQLMREQLAPEQVALLDHLAAAPSWEAMQPIIAEHGSWALQRAAYQRQLRLGYRRLDLEIEALIYLIEGKAFLECYNSFFGYVARVIALQREHHPLAAAVKLFLQ